MEKTFTSELIGTFHLCEYVNYYEMKEGKIHWALDFTDENDDLNEMLNRAEKLYKCIDDIDKKLKNDVAKSLIDYKNDFYPEYDKNDDDFSWDKADAGYYDVTIERFTDAIELYDVVIRPNDIYLEYYDGELFLGHRIHVTISNEYVFIEADI